GDVAWVAFASERGVTALVEAARTAGTLDVLRTRKLAAVGPGTAAALAAHGLEPTLVAVVSTGEGLAEALVPRLQPGEVVLLPAAEEGRRSLEEGLAAAGGGGEGGARDRVGAPRRGGRGGGAGGRLPRAPRRLDARGMGRGGRASAAVRAL